MFYTRINKIKVFNNREGFLGLFNRAEMRIYSYAVGQQAGTGIVPSLTLSDLAGLPDEAARRQKLLETVQAEATKLSQSYSLEVNGVKDNQAMLFGESGMLIYKSETIPGELNIQLWVIESDEDVRRFTVDADRIIDSDAFRGLLIAVETALTVTNPILSGIIGIGAVVVNLLRQKLHVNKDDLVGYWQLNLNRMEHYPHGTRDRQDVPDTTGNILVDYTLFGFENEVLPVIMNEDAEPGNKTNSTLLLHTEESGTEADFIRQIYPAAQRLYESGEGLHPLFVTAQAALETGWKIKEPGNNIFGITKGSSWTGAVNLLPTVEIFSVPDKAFTLPEKVISVEQLAPDKYCYQVYRLFRAYASLDESLTDHLALLKSPLYQDAWPYRDDPREYARRIAGRYATSPDYAGTLIAVMDRIAAKLQN